MNIKNIKLLLGLGIDVKLTKEQAELLLEYIEQLEDRN